MHCVRVARWRRDTFNHARTILRAKYPSSQSVKAAATKIPEATAAEYGSVRPKSHIMGGIKKSLETVRIVGNVQMLVFGAKAGGSEPSDGSVASLLQRQTNKVLSSPLAELRTERTPYHVNAIVIQQDFENKMESSRLSFGVKV